MSEAFNAVQRIRQSLETLESVTADAAIDAERDSAIKSISVYLLAALRETEKTHPSQYALLLKDQRIVSFVKECGLEVDQADN